jgi:putrescine transport system ATP-binding protein
MNGNNNHNFQNKKPLVVLENVSKQYPGSTASAVDNVSVSIYEGELFALLGPSGCGKTTIMRMLAGFETPTSGKIIIDGVDILHIPAYERSVNMMFQSYALFPHMTVEQNIAFGLKQEKLPKDEIRHRVHDALKMVKMTEFAKRKPRQLSGGQQQRVALARSLIKRPKLLLLDEPLGALDRQNREHTQMELINIQNMLGITFIMVTHDQEEAMALANRIAVMGNGNILKVGTPEEIYEYPKSKFVANFIGSINMFHGEISENTKDGFVKVRCNKTGTDIKVHSDGELKKGREAWVAVRPEEIEISTSPAPTNENQVEGTIIDIAFMGDKIIYHVSLASAKIVNVSMPTAARNKNANLALNSKVYISWYETDGVVLTN